MDAFVCFQKQVIKEALFEKLVNRWVREKCELGSSVLVVEKCCLLEKVVASSF